MDWEDKTIVLVLALVITLLFIIQLLGSFINESYDSYQQNNRNLQEQIDKERQEILNEYYKFLYPPTTVQDWI